MILEYMIIFFNIHIIMNIAEHKIYEILPVNAPKLFFSS